MPENKSDRIPCPKCGRNLFELVAEMKDTRELRCPECGSTIEVDFRDPHGRVSKSPSEIVDDIFGDFTS